MSETINAYKVDGAMIEHDEEGYLKDIGEWTPELADLIAKAENIDMADEHWEVVNFLRDYYEEYQIAPAVRILMKEMTKKYGKEKGDQKYLYSLFPYGPAKQACKIAGLPKPTGCV
jgi:TusE/DsrC/DsvC family sulfur relay protein